MGGSSKWGECEACRFNRAPSSFSAGLSYLVRDPEPALCTTHNTYLSTYVHRRYASPSRFCDAQSSPRLCGIAPCTSPSDLLCKVAKFAEREFRAHHTQNWICTSQMFPVIPFLVRQSDTILIVDSPEAVIYLRKRMNSSSSVMAPGIWISPIEPKVLVSKLDKLFGISGGSLKSRRFKRKLF